MCSVSEIVDWNRCSRVAELGESETDGGGLVEVEGGAGEGELFEGGGEDEFGLVDGARAVGDLEERFEDHGVVQPTFVGCVDKWFSKRLIRLDKNRYVESAVMEHNVMVASKILANKFKELSGMMDLYFAGGGD